MNLYGHATCVAMHERESFDAWKPKTRIYGRLHNVLIGSGGLNALFRARCERSIKN